MPTFRTEDRLVGGAAVAFAVALFVQVLLTDLPDLSSSNAQALEFYRDPAQRARSVAAAYAAALTGILFVVFLVGTVRRLRRGGSDAVALGAVVGGGVFVALFLASAALFAAPVFAVSLNNEPVQLDRDFALLARLTSVAGDSLLLVFAPFAAAIFVSATTIGSRATGDWPRWLTALGWIVAVSLVVPLVFFSMTLFMVWSLGVGIRLLVVGSARPR